MTLKNITIDLPGAQPIILTHLLLDFTGTLSYDGRLIDGVAERLRAISEKLKIIVLTADTFGTAREALQGLPLEMVLISTARDKLAYIQKIGTDQAAAVGNGCNDVDMVREAVLGIAIIGPEGASGKLIQVADVVVTNINDALDLLLNPLRLTATLRQ